MDDIIALLAREAGKKFAEAQKRAAADAAAANADPRAALRAALAQQRPGLRPAPTAPQRPTAAPQPPVVAAPRVAAAPSLAIDAPDPLIFDTPGIAGLPAPAVRPELHLLAAFGGGSALLAGIVLAEALAPPVALRESQLFNRIER